MAVFTVISQAGLIEVDAAVLCVELPRRVTMIDTIMVANSDIDISLI